MPKLSIKELEVQDQEVLMRVDFNVPLKDGEITDDTRIVAALPSIKELLAKGAKLVLCSHLGRPNGQKVESASLAPVAARLANLLGQGVMFAHDCIGDPTLEQRAQLQSGGVLLLENVRFYNEETENEANFAKALAGKAKIFVNDAFGTAHRAHASTHGVTKFVEKAAMGHLMALELAYLQDELEAPQQPFVVIIGGAKVSDKIQVISSLMEKASAFIIGGAMAYTFRKAQGYEVGDSLVENDKLDLALDLLEQAKAKGVDFLLPADTLITQEFKDGAETQNTQVYGQGGTIPAGWEGIDIGEVAIKEFSDVLMSAKTVLWNGPMGVFEIDSFATGTKKVAEALAQSDALSIVGGGDSVTAVKKFNLQDKMSFISTGGGASLELLEGKVLPGVDALTEI